MVMQTFPTRPTSAPSLNVGDYQRALRIKGANHETLAQHIIWTYATRTKVLVSFPVGDYYTTQAAFTDTTGWFNCTINSPRYRFISVGEDVEINLFDNTDGYNCYTTHVGHTVEERTIWVDNVGETHRFKVQIRDPNAPASGSMYTFLIVEDPLTRSDVSNYVPECLTVVGAPSPSAWDAITVNGHHMIYVADDEIYLPRRFVRENADRLLFYEGGTAPGVGANTPWGTLGAQPLNQIGSTTQFADAAGGDRIRIDINPLNTILEKPWCIYTDLWVESAGNFGALPEEAIELKISGYTAAGTTPVVTFTWTAGGTPGDAQWWDGAVVQGSGPYQAGTGAYVEYMLIVEPTTGIATCYLYQTMQVVAQANYSVFPSVGAVGYIELGTQVVAHSTFRIRGDRAIVLYQLQ